MLHYTHQYLRRFRTSESGAVTTDFAVLVAATVLMGFAVVGTFNDETVAKSDEIAKAIDDQKVQ
ncbi:hypothetical protein ACJ5NV_00890 [Loktanella agnita]|uniref:hypothetical protein n=1 Tax=Loktanella agnita TaxID=287097 RepID=UPI00398708A7